MQIRSRIKKLSLLAAVLCFIVTVGFATEHVCAATTYTEGDFYYEIKDESIVITGYFGYDTEITLPSMIAGYPVSEIATGAFANTKVKTIHLPDTIMTIGEDAIPVGVTVEYAGDNIGGTTDDKNNDSGNSNTNTGNNKSDSAGTDSSENNTADNNSNNINTSGEKNGVDEAEINLSNVKDESSSDKISTNKLVVDDKGRLLAKDDNGKTVMIDDSKKYQQKTDDNGNTVIVDEDGNEVQLSDDENKVTYTDQDGKQVTKDIQTKKSSSYVGIIIAVVVVVILAAIGGVFLWQKKKKQK